MKYEGKMDLECIGLCNAINEIQGLRTFESCCGHGAEPYRIWFWAKDIESLAPLLYYIDIWHTSFDGWSVKTNTDCSMKRPTFYIEGPVGAYEEAEQIAKSILAFLETEEGKKYKFVSKGYFVWN